jgi:hypothetical protein
MDGRIDALVVECPFQTVRGSQERVKASLVVTIHNTVSNIRSSPITLTRRLLVPQDVDARRLV